METGRTTGVLETLEPVRDLPCKASSGMSMGPKHREIELEESLAGQLEPEEIVG